MKDEGGKRRAYCVILNKYLFIKFNITVKSRFPLTHRNRATEFILDNALLPERVILWNSQKHF
jgi:hypothetical protein